MQTNNPVQVPPVNQVQMQPVNQYMQPIAIPVRNVPKSVPAYKGLAITQLVIGVLNLILGIVLRVIYDYMFFALVGMGIWNGVFITLAGILGVCAVGQLENNGCLNGTYMGFSIFATLNAIGCTIYSIVGAMFWCVLEFRSHGCHHSEPGRALLWVIFVLNLAEVGVAIAAAVFCCRNTNCCNQTTQGVIVTQPAQYQYQTGAYPSGATAANIPQSQAGGVPAKGAAPYPQQFATAGYPGQMISQAPNGMIITSQPYVMAGQAGQVNMTYSAEHTQQAPPPYSPMGENR